MLDSIESVRKNQNIPNDNNLYLLYEYIPPSMIPINNNKLPNVAKSHKVFDNGKS
jgi:hypothetical protein